MPAARLSQTIGFYIAGTALGGMLGRAFGALLSDHYSWRLALLGLGLDGLAVAWQFHRMLPHTASRGSQNKAASPDLRSLQQMVGSVVNQVRQPKLLAPYLFSQSTVAGITVFYIFGIGSSLWGAMLTKRLPLRTLVPMALTLMLLGLCATLTPDVRMTLLVSRCLLSDFLPATPCAATGWPQWCRRQRHWSLPCTCVVIIWVPVPWAHCPGPAGTRAAGAQWCCCLHCC